MGEAKFYLNGDGKSVLKLNGFIIMPPGSDFLKVLLFTTYCLQKMHILAMGLLDCQIHVDMTQLHKEHNAIKLVNALPMQYVVKSSLPLSLPISYIC